jgi:type I restriction enzyme S subunit
VTVPAVELSKVIRVHYGAALKEADRNQLGTYQVFGSSGVVGHHSEFLFDYPSLVIGRKGSAGSVTYAPNGGWAIDTAFFVERIDPKSSDIRYLYYALKNARLAQHTITTSIPGLSRDDIYRTQVRLPRIEEQQRIADILDKADAIRRKRKEAIALTEELLRSAFLEMFGDPVTNPKGWPVKPLGELADVAGGLQVTGARAGNPISMPYLRVANVYRDRLNLSEVKDIRVTEAERARATLRHGDVLVVEGHGNPEELGRSAVWRDEIAGCTHQNHLIRVRATAGVLDATFLSAFLNSSSGKKQMLALGKTTSGLNTISTNNVRSVQIVVPPLRQQAEYAEVVGRIATLGETMQRRSAGDEDLFNSLVARAFSGALSS